ncbi:hypothetical protein MATL_G00215370 [Megalops atlanticus]|uniref:Uncharacterized protein n=1 Tax=Megalops atlanticus TaxID=7932 RepID=A0A9D3PJ92_MEGAT|nr:hypothetical protein MATL_G00215370 [Megalops atlanticus]
MLASFRHSLKLSEEGLTSIQNKEVKIKHRKSGNCKRDTFREGGRIQTKSKRKGSSHVEHPRDIAWTADCFSLTRVSTGRRTDAAEPRFISSFSD